MGVNKMKMMNYIVIGAFAYLGLYMLKPKSEIIVGDDYIAPEEVNKSDVVIYSNWNILENATNNMTRKTYELQGRTKTVERYQESTGTFRGFVTNQYRILENGVEMGSGMDVNYATNLDSAYANWRRLVGSGLVDDSNLPNVTDFGSINGGNPNGRSVSF